MKEIEKIMYGKKKIGAVFKNDNVYINYDKIKFKNMKLFKEVIYLKETYNFNKKGFLRKGKFYIYNGKKNLKGILTKKDFIIYVSYIAKKDGNVFIEVSSTMKRAKDKKLKEILENWKKYF